MQPAWQHWGRARLQRLQPLHGGVLLLLDAEQALDGVRRVHQLLPQPHDLACGAGGGALSAAARPAAALRCERNTQRTLGGGSQPCAKAGMQPWPRPGGAPSDASRKSGSVSRRSVWPVGAVSNTMRLKCAYSGELMNCTTRLMATASSTPGGSVSSSSPGRGAPG